MLIRNRNFYVFDVSYFIDLYISSQLTLTLAGCFVFILLISDNMKFQISYKME